MKSILLLFSLALYSIAGFAQVPSDYTLGATSGNVDCYFKMTTCNGKTVVLLLFDNRNTTSVAVSWTDIFATQQMPQNKPGYWPGYATLPAGLTSASSCDDPDHKNCILGEKDVSPTYRAIITHFEFSDVNVSTGN